MFGTMATRFVSILGISYATADCMLSSPSPITR